MAAQPVPHPSTDKRRVKVYELRDSDWFDRGTGFCAATFTTSEDGQQQNPRVVVESEDHPLRILLETRICKEDGFHKQQETLIVWTDPSSGVDMALSFQEAEGCAIIWKFINSVQQQNNPSNPQDDSLSDDLAMDIPNLISLPEASMANLPEIESQMRMMSSTQAGRDALTKYVISENYISKLIPIVSDAEDLESLPDLHRLCNIMKMIILLNDTSIIEYAVSDECVVGVVGALEYDPDFPSHKANHRQWLQREGRFREVVPIEDDQVRKKIHQTYRLQYLKDVVLARILDDSTFSVLNSLIFFNQVDIVQHIQANTSFLGELFGIFKTGQDLTRKKEAVLFIQQCCAIAKNLQPPARTTLYNNFIANGLLQVVNFGLKSNDVSVRVGATDILVSMIDHDAQMIRHTMYRQVAEKQQPLTDTLIDLLLVETDLGVKSQIADALKILLDHAPPINAETYVKAANGEYVARARIPQGPEPQHDNFLRIFYEDSAVRLFQPLIALQHRTTMEFTVGEAMAFSYLVEILCYYVRQHNHRSKFFVMTNNIVLGVTQLLQSPEKFLKLVAVRLLRQLVGTQDEFYIKHLIEKRAIEPVLDLLIQTLPRDNLISSACLDLFEHVRKENIKELVKHMVENYREKLRGLSYMEPFRALILRYDQTAGFTANMDYFAENDDESSRERRRSRLMVQRAPMEHLTVDQAEEDYFNTSDDEDDLTMKLSDRPLSTNQESSNTKLLVDYGSDEDPDDHVEAGAISGDEDRPEGGDRKVAAKLAESVAPPERVSDKRRREEDEDDDLSKLVQHKRRNSTSAGSNASTALTTSPVGPRKRKPGGGVRDLSTGPKKISISLSSATKAGDASGND